MMELISISMVLLVVLRGACAIGEFYEPSRNQEVEVLNLNRNNKRVSKKTLQPVDMHGTKYSEIYIYLDGLIGFSGNDFLQETCPYRPIKMSPEKFIAPYWLRNTDGTVTFFQEATPQGQILPYGNRIAQEINTAFTKADISGEDISFVTFITWTEMTNSANIRSQERENSFQLVLVNAKGKSYVHFIYRLLGSYSVQSLNGVDQDCQENAVIGINAGLDYRFDLSGFFFLRRDWTIYFTNEEDFQRLGRYVFGLYKDIAQQPLPPRLNCIGDMPDPICQVSLWDSVKEVISEEFCKYRKVGVYPYPLSCDHFVHCIHGRPSVKRCGTNLHFNPVLQVCDWKAHVECNIPTRVVIETEDKKPSLPSPTPRHNNFCAQKRDGIFPDPLTCDHYFMCSNTRTIVVKCPADLHFNVIGDGNGICNFRRNVKCKNGIRTIVA